LAEIERSKFFPLSQDEQGVSFARSFIGAFRKLDARIQFSFSTLVCRGIIGADFAAFLKE
jgi:hypothetical protein